VPAGPRRASSDRQLTEGDPEAFLLPGRHGQADPSGIVRFDAASDLIYRLPGGNAGGRTGDRRPDQPAVYLVYWGPAWATEVHDGRTPDGKLYSSRALAARRT